MSKDILNQEQVHQLIIQHLKEIYDPEMPVNIYDLGLIYDIILMPSKDKQFKCEITMTLTNVTCPVGETLYQQVTNIALFIEPLESIWVELVFDPPWDMDKMSDEGKLELGYL